MTVYVDVLLAINFFVNYLLLASAKCLMRLNTGTLRMVVGASLGAAYSLIIFAQSLNAYIKLLLNLAVLSVMILTAFAPKKLKSFVRELAAFLAVNFVFAGLMLAVWLFFSPEGMLYDNTVVYFDIDIKLLIILSAVCYAVIRAVTALIGRRGSHKSTVSVTLSYGSSSVTVNALVDTGNSLRDSFSGAPVMIADSKTVKSLTGDSLYRLLDAENTSLKIRLIPVSTVSSDSLLAAFRADSAVIDGRYFYKNVFVAQSKTDIATDEYSLILNNDFINEGESNVQRKTEKAVFKNKSHTR